jgi:hypothetical protein
MRKLIIAYSLSLSILLVTFSQSSTGISLSPPYVYIEPKLPPYAKYQVSGNHYEVKLLSSIFGPWSYALLSIRTNLNLALMDKCGFITMNSSQGTYVLSATVPPGYRGGCRAGVLGPGFNLTLDFVVDLTNWLPGHTERFEVNVTGHGFELLFIGPSGELYMNGLPMGSLGLGGNYVVTRGDSILLTGTVALVNALTGSVPPILQPSTNGTNWLVIPLVLNGTETVYLYPTRNMGTTIYRPITSFFGFNGTDIALGPLDMSLFVVGIPTHEGYVISKSMGSLSYVSSGYLGLAWGVLDTELPSRTYLMSYTVLNSSTTWIITYTVVGVNTYQTSDLALMRMSPSPELILNSTVMGMRAFLTRVGDYYVAILASGNPRFVDGALALVSPPVISPVNPGVYGPLVIIVSRDPPPYNATIVGIEREELGDPG